MDASRQSESRRSAFQDMLRLLSFLRPFKRLVLIVIAVVALINFLELTNMLLVGETLNAFRSGQEDAAPARSPIQLAVRWVVGLVTEQVGDVETGYVVLALGLLFAASGVARAGLIRFREPLIMRLAMDLLRWLRTTLYGKVQAMSFSYLDRLTSGQIIERATGDVNLIRTFLTQQCFQAFNAVVMGLLAVGFMAYMSWELTLIVLLPFPLIMVLYAKWAGRIRYFRRRIQDQVDVMTTALNETISGSRVIRSFGKHEEERSRYRAITEELFQRVIPMIKIRAFKLVGVYSMARLWAVVILLVGGWMVMRGSLNVGYILTFTMMMWSLLWRAQALMQLGEGAQEARAALERVMALMDARPLPEGGGEIVFENVSFAYTEPPHPEADVIQRLSPDEQQKGPAAVGNVSLHVNPGERVALVGPTGAGKSTVISMLPRFYDPNEGRVLIDGQDVRLTQLQNLRRAIGIVFQETFLFRGTIAENIAYGRPDASRERIMRAARQAAADEFIQEAPGGYDTEIGERGVSLSGGQRQRLAIARAILKQPRILVLDDAMASVDAHTEQKIRGRLRELMEGRTTLIIAHRLATVRTADRVVVMNDGRVEDVGTHEELIRRNPFYRQLCESQLEADDLPEMVTEGGGS